MNKFSIILLLLISSGLVGCGGSTGDVVDPANVVDPYSDAQKRKDTEQINQELMAALAKQKKGQDGDLSLDYKIGQIKERPLEMR